MGDSLQFLHKLFEYDHWANREALASLSTVSGSAERPLRILGHIMGAQGLWLARFDNPSPPGGQAWPTLTLDDCRVAVEDMHRRWSQVLDKLTPEKMSEALVYRNTKGQEFRTPIQDVLMHLLMHSAYHRGQLAAAVREAGGKPAGTDYVVYVRQK